MEAPRIFVSYTHDSQEHKDWVRKLATDLRTHGIDIILDQWDLVLGQDIAAFMEKGIRESSRVLVVCSENYVKKTEAGQGGAGYERLIVTAEVVQKIATTKFIPIIRNNNLENKVPRYLGPRLYADFNDDASYSANLERLVREILGIPALTKPPLGQSPFSGQLGNQAESVRQTGPTGVTPKGQNLLDDQWFKREADAALKGRAKLKVTGFMEVRIGLHDSINKSQIDLLAGMRNSTINTFGWPIGVTIETRDDFRPKPYGDGIRAEVSIENDPITSRTSYDYWSLRSNGDFFLTQSFFEDQRTTNTIFFNTRIVRVAETLLFANNLYTNLGAPPETRISIRVAHVGIANRSLSSSNSNRILMPFQQTSHENESQTEIVTILGSIRKTLVDDVRRITEPMFMLFDFAKFDDSVYADIVRKFEQGQVT